MLLLPAKPTEQETKATRRFIDILHNYQMEMICEIVNFAHIYSIAISSPLPVLPSIPIPAHPFPSPLPSPSPSHFSHSSSPRTSPPSSPFPSTKSHNPLARSSPLSQSLTTEVRLRRLNGAMRRNSTITSPSATSPYSSCPTRASISLASSPLAVSPLPNIHYSPFRSGSLPVSSLTVSMPSFPKHHTSTFSETMLNAEQACLRPTNPCMPRFQSFSMSALPDLLKLIYPPEQPANTRQRSFSDSFLALPCNYADFLTPLPHETLSDYSTSPDWKSTSNSSFSSIPSYHNLSALDITPLSTPPDSPLSTPRSSFHKNERKAPALRLSFTPIAPVLSTPLPQLSSSTFDFSDQTRLDELVTLFPLSEQTFMKLFLSTQQWMVSGSKLSVLFPYLHFSVFPFLFSFFLSFFLISLSLSLSCQYVHHP